jgi:glycosyltransferase involved in cell wall biosynthesis
MNSHKALVNLRSQSAGLTGVQRYSRELCKRLNSSLDTVAPQRPLHGLMGHLWEQTKLPLLVGRRLLWSPANTGPLAVSHQVLTIHDVASLDHPEWFGSRFAGWYRWMTPALVRRVRLVITVSEFSKQRLVVNTGIKESSVEVIPNGVGDQFHPRSPDEIREVLNRLGVPTDRYVLILGSIEPRKNLARLLEAWRLSTARLPPDVWLVIAGAQGKHHIFATTACDELPPRVYSTGFVRDEDLPELYSGALAMIYPSLYEGFGLPALEAMAAGTAVVVARSTALEDLTADAGVLVNPYDINAIAEAIERIVQDPKWREEFRDRGLERSRAFTWERSALATKRALETAYI